MGVGTSAHLGAKEDVVGALHAQHERVVLVADLVLVAAKAASRPDARLAQPGQGLVQHAVPGQAGSGVAMLQPPAATPSQALRPLTRHAFSQPDIAPGHQAYSRFCSVAQHGGAYAQHARRFSKGT